MIKFDKNKLIDVSLIIMSALITVMVYLVVLLTINRGTSCDEGYYLLSYLPEQPIGWGISQFFYMVRSLGLDANDNALTLRYLRFALSFISLLFFSITSYRYLVVQFKSTINKYLYVSLVMLAGVLAYTFASPVLYYDNIQAILYFIVFGCLFLSLDSKFLFSAICQVLSGFAIVFAVFNYLPSGLLLLIIYLFISFISIRTQKIYSYTWNLIFIVSGIILGLIFYHYAVHNLFDTFQIIQTSFNTAQSGITSHDNSSLIFKALMYIVQLVLSLIFFFIPGLSYFYLVNKNSGNRTAIWVIQLLYLSVYLFLLTQRVLFTTYYSHIIILPVSLLIAEILLNSFYAKKFSIDFRLLLLILTFWLIPLAGAFGTNQLLSAKALFFMPFWVVLFALIYSVYGLVNKYLKLCLYLVIWVSLVVTTYMHLGYFTRFQYYYTPTSSKYELTGNERFKSIQVAEWQKNFNENAFNILKSNGYSKGDKILAFYDNFITVYAVGAFVPQKLYYQFEVFAANKKNIPANRVDYILIIKEQEKPMADFLKDTNWDFPAGYDRFDLGKASQNLPSEGYNSILFIKKNK